MFSCVFVTFPYGVPGQVWYLIASIPDICILLYFVKYFVALSTALYPNTDFNVSRYNGSTIYGIVSLTSTLLIFDNREIQIRLTLEGAFGKVHHNSRIEQWLGCM